jgi:hypothetical protein
MFHLRFSGILVCVQLHVQSIFLALVQVQPHVHSTLGVIPLFFPPIGLKKMNYLIFFLLLHFENPVCRSGFMTL